MKKLFATLFFPVPLTLMLLAVGLFLVHNKWIKFPHSRQIGKVAIIVSILLFLLYSMFGWYPTMKLEYKYEPLHVTRELSIGAPYVIAVFGNSYIGDKTLPAPHRFQSVMSMRMFEAARVAHELQKLDIEYTIAVSLPVAADTAVDFPKEARLADARYYFSLFGIPPENVEMIQDTCINSKDEIHEFAKYNKRLILVSSPTHVPRLMTLAHKCGLEAIAAPAAMDFDRNYPPNCRPIVQNLEYLRQAAYEFLGTLQYELLW